MADPLYKNDERVPGTVYRVVRHLATGGMGTVYDVEDVSVGKRYVLKTLNPDLLERADLQKRMEAEARILGRLQHPNIVEVVTAGQTTDKWNLPYFVMERLTGQNLRSILDKTGQLALVQAVRIAIDLLDALDHAHDNSVVHRDVKPENIFLHKGVSGTTTTKLLDFGIMRLVDAGRVDAKGRFVGTVRYAAPEQIAGATLSAKVDIYAAALVLYEMLTGTGPFDHLDDPNKIGAAHLHTRPPPLSARVVIPADLETIVMQALEKDPDLRPKDAFTFAGDLRRFLRGTDRAAEVTRDTPSSLVAGSPAGGVEVATDLGSQAPSSAERVAQPVRTVSDGWARTQVDRSASTRTFNPEDGGGGEGSGGDTELPPNARPHAAPNQRGVSAEGSVAGVANTRSRPNPPRRVRTATYALAAIVVALLASTIVMLRTRIERTGASATPTSTASATPTAIATATAIGTAIRIPTALPISTLSAKPTATSTSPPTPTAAPMIRPAKPLRTHNPRPVPTGGIPRLPYD